MSEHAGGAPKQAVVPFTSWRHESFEVVPVFEWDAASIDKLSELIQDHVSTGGDVRELMMRVMAPEIEEARSEVVRKTLSLIRTTRAKKVKLLADQMAWASGLAMMEGDTISTLAKRRGISKQAFQQGADNLRDLLIVRSQSRRTDEARDKMSKNNYRGSKCKA